LSGLLAVFARNGPYAAQDANRKVSANVAKNRQRTADLGAGFKL
jgi:hypothetical protein